MNARTTGIGIALVTAVVSGVAIFVNGNGVKAYGDATSYTTAKNVAAAVLISAIVLAFRRSTAKPAMPTRWRQWAGLAAVAVIGGAVPFVLFFEGLARATTNQASVVHKSLIVWVAILAVIVLKEKLTWVHYAAIGAIFVAQVALAGGFGGFVAAVTDPGFLMIGAATLMWAGEVIVAKRLLADLAPGTVSIARMAGGAVVLIAWSFIRGTAGSLIPATANQWGWVALTGVLLAAYVLTWHEALARAQAVDVSAVLVLGVVITAGLGAAFNGADVSAGAPWYATILIGCGALVWASRRSPVSAVPASA